MKKIIIVLIFVFLASVVGGVDYMDVVLTGEEGSSINYMNVVLLVYDVGAEPPVDTCTYSGSGTWAVDCSDNCAISTTVDLNGEDITITGTGTFTITGNIINADDIIITGTSSTDRCMVYCNGAECIRS